MNENRLGISGRIAGFFQAAQITPLLALVALLLGFFAVLVVDYYVLRGRRLDLAKLYDENGPYRGVNWAGMLATLAGAAVALSFPSISWYASLLPAGVVYYLLMNHWAPCRRFLDGEPSVAAPMTASRRRA